MTSVMAGATASDESILWTPLIAPPARQLAITARLSPLV